jgi:hypothetical protein
MTSWPAGRQITLAEKTRQGGDPQAQCASSLARWLRLQDKFSPAWGSSVRTWQRPSGWNDRHPLALPPNLGSPPFYSEILTTRKPFVHHPRFPPSHAHHCHPERSESFARRMTNAVEGPCVLPLEQDPERLSSIPCMPSSRTVAYFSATGGISRAVPTLLTGPRRVPRNKCSLREFR